jgi:RimJ/RimL family protein N-acetyltransferase
MPLHGFHPELLPLFARLAGRRTLLTPMARGDGEGIYEAVDEDRAHLRPWLPWVDHHQSIDDSEAFARRAAGMWLTREDLIVAIRDLDGRLLGGSGLHRIDWERRAFEIGYWIRKSATGKGHVTEAVQLLTAVCFDRLDASRVEIRCDPRNERSSAVPERLGFVREAHFRSQSRAPDGTLRDTLVYALTPSSFMELDWAADAKALVAAADSDG